MRIVTFDLEGILYIGQSVLTKLTKPSFSTVLIGILSLQSINMSASVIAVFLDPPLSKLALLLKISNNVDCEERSRQFDCELTEHSVIEALEATLCGL